jgi:ubiquinone/menaquinone biosynthesis C-methylase UbiE
MPDARISQGHISDLYRKIAPRYDLWARMTESKARDRCLEIAAIQDGESVLEVAVGTGLAFERILKGAEKRAASAGFKSYRLTVGDAYNLDFPDNDFDVLINNYMFDLLPEDDFQIVLAEFRRVLRPGGRCRGVQVSPFLGQIGFVTLGRQYISQMTFPSEVICAVAE